MRKREQNTPFAAACDDYAIIIFCEGFLSTFSLLINDYHRARGEVKDCTNKHLL